MQRLNNSVEGINVFSGVMEYRRSFGKACSISATLRKDLLRDESFASKTSVEMPTWWGDPKNTAFLRLKALSLVEKSSCSFHEMAPWFTLHMDATTIRAGACATPSHAVQGIHH